MTLSDYALKKNNRKPNVHWAFLLIHPKDMLKLSLKNNITYRMIFVILLITFLGKNEI